MNDRNQVKHVCIKHRLLQQDGDGTPAPPAERAPVGALLTSVQGMKASDAGGAQSQVKQSLIVWLCHLNLTLTRLSNEATLQGFKGLESTCDQLVKPIQMCEDQNVQTSSMEI